MLKFIKLSVLIIFSLLFVSCSNLSREESDIIIDAGPGISRAIKASRAVSSEEEMNNAVDNAIGFKIDFLAGVKGDYSTEVNRTYSYNYTDIDNINDDDFEALTIPAIPVGSNVTVYAEIEAGVYIKNKDALVELARVFGEDTSDFAEFDEDAFVEFFEEMFGFSFALKGEEGPVRIEKGDNNVTIALQWDKERGYPGFDDDGDGDGDRGINGDGRIRTALNELYSIRIKTPANTTKYYNDSDITFGLYDKDGNDVSAEHYVDSGDWEYKLLYGGTEIPVNISGTPCWQYATSTFTINTLPQSGIYQLYVQLKPYGSQGENPELMSAIFNIDYTKAAYYTFNAANLMDGYNPSTQFTNFVDAINTDAVIKFTGEGSESYGDIIGAVSDAFDNFSYLVSLDFSEMRTSADQKYLSGGYAVQNFTKLSSITFPDDLTKISNDDFSGCTNLKSVTFGSGIKFIGTDGGGSFQYLTALSSVIIPSDAELQIIFDNSFAGCSSLKYLKLPASVSFIGAGAFDSELEELVLSDTSGTWYWTDDDYGFNNMTNEIMFNPNNTEGPEYFITDPTTRGTLDSYISTLNNPELYDTLAKKIVYAVSHGKYLYKMD